MSSQALPARALDRRRSRRNTRALKAGIGLLLAAGFGWWGWNKIHASDDPNGKLLTATVTRGDLYESVSATGSVTAQTGAQVKIGSQITGRIKHLYADVGTNVKAGQVIAELDLPDVKAQLDQAEANLTSAQTKLVQQITGVGMEKTQTKDAVSQAQAALNSARAKLASAEAASRQQTAQTPNDIARAQAAVSAAKAALSTAKSNLTQTQASVNLQVATAQEQLKQAQANAANSSIDLKRQQALLDKGFVAASVVDAARALSAVNQSQVQAAQQNIDLIKAKVAADLQASKDQVTQAEQNLQSAIAAQASAQAEKFQDSAKLADVEDARAQVRQAEANLQTAIGNITQDTLKQQDVKQAQEAVTASKAMVDFNSAQWDKTFIRSPISGTVLQLAAQQGETLAAGLSAPTLIIVADLNRLQVDAYVDETDIGKLQIGQDADVTVDAFPKRVLKGRVAKIASGSTIQQGVITYDVTIALNPTKNRLKPDMTASVTVKTGKRENVLLVPSEAVKAGKRGATVNALINKDGKSQVTTVKIRTGGSDGVNTEIRSGLKEGDKVVLAGFNQRPQQGGPASPFGPAGGGRGGGGGGGGRG